MNGFIQLQKTLPPVINELGEDVSPEPWFEQTFIACKYSTPNSASNSTSYLRDEAGGIYPKISYTITTKAMNINAARVRLFNSQKELICEKDVQLLQVLSTIKRTKIIL